MNKLILSIMIFSVIGIAFPSAFADIYVHESSFPFSIQHPSEWKSSPEDEWGGVNFDSDKTNRNGMWVSLACSEYRGEDCGIAGADYEELNWLKEDEQYWCSEATLEVDYVSCSNLRFVDEYAHQIDGYRAFTVVESYQVYQDGSDPMYPDGKGLHEVMGTATYILVGNDIWVILTSNDVEQFDLETHEKVISTFKINNIYDQDDLFSQSSWLDNLIKAIMSLFNWGNDSNSSTNTVIEQSSEAEYQPEQNYDYDNPIIVELDPCDLNDWDC